MLTGIERLIVIAIAACIALLLWLGIRSEHAEWEAFKTIHKCKEVVHISGDVFNTIGVGSNGQVSIGVGATPDKTGWACNDGKTYFRAD